MTTEKNEWNKKRREKVALEKLGKRKGFPQIK